MKFMLNYPIPFTIDFEVLFIWQKHNYFPVHDIAVICPNANTHPQLLLGINVDYEFRSIVMLYWMLLAQSLFNFQLTHLK